jgi:hypothetical protein
MNICVRLAESLCIAIIMGIITDPPPGGKPLFLV